MSCTLFYKKLNYKRLDKQKGTETKFPPLSLLYQATKLSQTASCNWFCFLTLAYDNFADTFKGDV